MAGSEKDLVIALWAAFVVQIVGRLLDLQWHRTHDEFETGTDQLEAHWLVWLGTVFVIAVTITALRIVEHGQQKRGYATALLANALYAVAALIHFVQHMNHSEVDWTHVSLAVTNLGAVVGVVWVTAAFLRNHNRTAVPTS